MKRLFKILLIIIALNILTINVMAMTKEEITPYLGKTCKIYYNDTGIIYGKILRFNLRIFKFPDNDILTEEDIKEFKKLFDNINMLEVVVEQKNALNQTVYGHYLIFMIDKLED